jgi:hypothetical protein
MSFTTTYATKKDYGIHIMRPAFIYPTLMCWKCSISPEKFWKDDSDQYRHIKRCRDDRGLEYDHWAGCYCVAEKDYVAMAKHVCEHILAGEDIHPSVLQVLYEHHNHEFWMHQYHLTQAMYVPGIRFSIEEAKSWEPRMGFPTDPRAEDV